MPTGTTTPQASHPPINGQTQGVVGMSNLTLSQTNPKLGSVVTSEKSNVKLDSGTLMLLRVSQEVNSEQLRKTDSENHEKAQGASTDRSI